MAYIQYRPGRDGGHRGTLPGPGHGRYPERPLEPFRGIPVAPRGAFWCHWHFSTTVNRGAGQLFPVLLAELPFVNSSYGDREVVVGVALFRDGRVLAAHRPARAGAAGGWEFPGGKVEQGESDHAAAVREIREELGVEVEVGAALGADQPIGDRFVLRVYAGRLLAGEPKATEHSELRWVAAEELEQLPWLLPDLPFLPRVREVILTEI
ncbi:(deoxy)nucleoside triphosphate pyrophosphohydrolase [Kribbella deserti]|uniref:8-oxo-dGTP diphosphatase n=1 Tax=Kribbella deserti TaxID=1926257 RepID=A0ABV6QMM0_9ACTN